MEMTGRVTTGMPTFMLFHIRYRLNPAEVIQRVKKGCRAVGGGGGEGKLPLYGTIGVPAEGSNWVPAWVKQGCQAIL